jgi:hypothetical protein
MKKLLALSLLATACVHAADDTPMLASPDQESFNKNKAIISIGIFIATPRTDGKRDSYKEQELDSYTGKNAGLLAITDGTTRYAYKGDVTRSITPTITAGSLVDNLRTSLGCDDAFLRNKTCYLYLGGKKMASETHILENTPVEYALDSENKVWKIRKNAANWAIVGFELGAIAADEILPSIKVADYNEKEYEKSYKKFSHVHKDTNSSSSLDSENS